MTSATTEDRKPTVKMTRGMNLPILCFLRWPRAIMAETKWTNKDENIAQRNTVYQMTADDKYNFMV